MSTEGKYTVNVAYTTPSGRMHIGHGLGHTISDVFLRYGALKEEKDTFFGFGIHSTGKDLLKIINALEEEEGLEENLDRYNISEEKREEILSLSDQSEQVEELIQEYRCQYQETIEQMGVSMDFESFFSTNQEGNQRFTQWTLKKLNEAGLIVETEAERPYCPKCGDVKHIDTDFSEVSSVGEVEWDKVRVEDGEIYGGDFKCRAHPEESIVVKSRKERAINYGDPEMQQETLNQLRNMDIFPRNYREDLEEIIRTRDAKPFERNSEDNVGAISPFDSSKRVEALSDSNIYMEFYAISQMINQGELNAENLTDSFFDYVYLGEGDPEDISRNAGLSSEMLEKARREVGSVYPVNISVVGYEHLGVHVPFSLFTHAAVLPEEFSFDEFIITSHVTKDGEKMSKSKGNVLYLDELIEFTKEEAYIEGLSEESSLDSIRFFLSYYQNLDKNFDWNTEEFKSVGIRGIRRYLSSVERAANSLERRANDRFELADKWFATMDQKTTQDITEKMDERDLRGALITLFDARRNALSRYLSSTDPNEGILHSFLKKQISMAYPVTPRVSEELRERYLGEQRLEWPEADEGLVFPEEYEEYKHHLEKEDYEKNLSGEVNATLGKMIGKGKIEIGGKARVFVPTEYQAGVLRELDFPLSDKIDVEFSAREGVDGIEIKGSK